MGVKTRQVVRPDPNVTYASAWPLPYIYLLQNIFTHTITCCLYNPSLVNLVPSCSLCLSSWTVKAKRTSILFLYVSSSVFSLQIPKRSLSHPRLCSPYFFRFPLSPIFILQAVASESMSFLRRRLCNVFLPGMLHSKCKGPHANLDK